MRVGGAVGDGNHDDHVGVVAVGAESFRAVENPVVAAALGGHAGAARVRSGGRLSQAPGADKLSRCQFADVLLFLRLIAGQKDVIGAERSVSRDNDAHRAINAR